MDDINDLIETLEDPVNPFGNYEDDEKEAAVITLPNEPHYRIPRGKYKGLVLPRMIGVKPSMAAKVEAVKQEIIADPEFQRHANTLSQTYAEVRREAEAKAEELAEIRIRLAAVMQLMIDQFEVEDTSSVAHSDGTVIRVQPEPHLVVVDKALFRLSCIGNGLQDLMTLPWGTANRLMKDRALEGFEPLDGGQLYMRPKVVFNDPFKKRSA